MRGCGMSAISVNRGLFRLFTPLTVVAVPAVAALLWSLASTQTPVTVSGKVTPRLRIVTLVLTSRGENPS